MPELSQLSHHLLEQWKQGEKDAITTLFERYELRLIRLVRSRIAKQLKSRIDSHAVVNSVFREFLEKVHQDEFIPQKPGSLWSYLVAIARNKVQHQIEHHLAHKRHPKHEINTMDEWTSSPELIDREPDAQEEVALMDELEQLLEPLKPMERLILVHRLEGISIEEIANSVSRSEAFVRGFLKKTRDKFEARLKSFL